MVANGGELHELSQAKIALQVGDVRDDFTYLVARELTQECILGSDFLVKHDCIIDLSQQVLQVHIDGQPIISATSSSRKRRCYLDRGRATFVTDNFHRSRYCPTRAC